MSSNEKYTEVELEIIKFDSEDIITTSNPNNSEIPTSDNETPFEPI